MILHIILFILTVFSTWLVGGAAYSFAVITILLSHEMGHYFMSVRYGIPATLPYFIPFPFSPFGTFGAIIKMKGVVIDRKALFDIGVAGPLSGFIVSVPFIVIGIKLSTIEYLTGSTNYLQLGDPLLFRMLQEVMVGELPRGADLVLHPFGYAGWVGLFVTALNLLPVGQLDGGHVVYAVFGARAKWISIAFIVALAVLAVFYNPGWLLLVLLLVIFGMRHPRPYDDDVRLDGRRKKIAFLMLIIFLLSFTPSPFPDLNIMEQKIVPDKASERVV